jgi:uncharacterized metal-binding protein YceD (DUF177 family)
MTKPTKTQPTKMTHDQPPHPLAQWIIDTESLPEKGKQITRLATPEECKALATALDILGVNALSAKAYAIRLAESHYRLSGSFEGEVVQACVVTLEPLVNKVRSNFSAEFRPESEISDDNGVIDINDDTEIEALAGSAINFGRVVFEELAATLDPYPRKSGAEFAPPADGAEPKPPSPFAVLAQLKNKERK